MMVRREERVTTKMRPKTLMFLQKCQYCLVRMTLVAPYTKPPDFRIL